MELQINFIDKDKILLNIYSFFSDDISATYYVWTSPDVDTSGKKFKSLREIAHESLSETAHEKFIFTGSSSLVVFERPHFFSLDLTTLKKTVFQGLGSSETHALAEFNSEYVLLFWKRNGGQQVDSGIWNARNGKRIVDLSTMSPFWGEGTISLFGSKKGDATSPFPRAVHSINFAPGGTAAVFTDSRGKFLLYGLEKLKDKEWDKKSVKVLLDEADKITKQNEQKATKTMANGQE